MEEAQDDTSALKRISCTSVENLFHIISPVNEQVSCIL